MADLRIVDAPEIPTENITGEEKLPTGGNGNYSISLDSLADYTKTKKDLADNTSVDTKVNGVRQELNTHIEDLLNPHQVTKGQIGLGNVDNTADADKPVSNSTQAAIISAVTPKADKSYVDNALSSKAEKTYVDNQLTLKANKADVYTKSETYTKQESSDLVNNRISTALTPINTSLDLAKRGIANRYDSSLTYNSGERVVLTNGDIVKSTIADNTANPNVDMTGWFNFESDQRSINNRNNTISHVALMLDAPVVDGKIFNVLSRDEPNFALVKPYSGGGLFKWDASSTSTPNGGTVFAHNTVSNGRFLRIIDSDVHVSWFAGHGWTGQDKTSRVQQAIDFANRLDGASALCVDGKYKITSSLMIDRKTDTTKGDFIVYGTGNNDGFLIDTPITMFSSRLPYNPSDAPAYTKAPCSEFTIFKVIDFEATTADLNNCVFDDKFLRLTFDSCTHRKMRGCKSAEFLQSIKYIGKNKFRQHTGYFIEAVDAYDFRVNGTEFENSGRGFKFTGIARGSYFDGNLYQGSGGHFVAIGGLFGGSVSKNYFEANGDQDIVLGINGGVSSGEINGNLHYLHTEQLADPNYYPVSLGLGRNITVSNCLSNGNIAYSDDTSALEITEFGNTVAVNRKKLSYDAKEVISFTPPVASNQADARLLRNVCNITQGNTEIGAVRLPPLINAGSEPFLTINNKSNVGLRIYPSVGERIEGVAYNDFFLHGLGEIKLARSTSDYWTII